MQICWENRKDGDTGEDCLVTVDGKDFETDKQGNVKAFWGHKFKNTGLRYELAFCIKTGHLVWINGPFPAGDWPDINIFRHGLKFMLDENERVEADDGYAGDDPKLIKTPQGPRYLRNDMERAAAALARSRQETGNRLFTKLEILNNRYTNDITTHGTVFRACAVLVQLSIEMGAMTLFDVADAYDNLQSTAPTVTELKEEIKDMDDEDYIFKDQKDLDIIVDDDEDDNSL